MRAIIALVLTCGCSTRADIDEARVVQLRDAYCGRFEECREGATDDLFCDEFTRDGTEGTPDCVVTSGEDVQPCLDGIAAAECDVFLAGRRPFACTALCAD